MTPNDFFSRALHESGRDIYCFPRTMQQQQLQFDEWVCLLAPSPNHSLETTRLRGGITRTTPSLFESRYTLARLLLSTVCTYTSGWVQQHVINGCKLEIFWIASNIQLTVPIEA